VLRWFLQDGEQLRGVAFPYVAGTHNLTGVLPAILAARVDATWGALAPGRAAAAVERLASSTFVAVTDRRIITAAPKTLLRRGELGTTYPLDDVRYVRPRTKQAERVRPTIGITTERSDDQWMFPASADHKRIDDLATVIADGASSRTAARVAIGNSAPEASSH